MKTFTSHSPSIKTSSNNDDAIGWITLDSYVPPYSAFCEGVTGK